MRARARLFSTAASLRCSATSSWSHSARGLAGGAGPVGPGQQGVEAEGAPVAEPLHVQVTGEENAPGRPVRVSSPVAAKGASSTTRTETWSSCSCTSSCSGRKRRQRTSPRLLSRPSLACPSKSVHRMRDSLKSSLPFRPRSSSGCPRTRKPASTRVAVPTICGSAGSPRARARAAPAAPRCAPAPGRRTRAAGGPPTPTPRRPWRPPRGSRRR